MKRKVLLLLICTNVTFPIYKPFYLVTLPKAGTNFIKFIIDDILKYKNISIKVEKSQVYMFPSSPIKQRSWAHAIAIPKNISTAIKFRYKIIFLIRDLRDQLVSFAYYIKKNRSNEKAKKLQPKLYELARLPINEMLREMMVDSSFFEDWMRINEPTNLTHINDFYDLYLPWMELPFVYTTRFENIIGPEGGGTEAALIEEIINIASFLDIKLTEKDAMKIAKGRSKWFGHSETYRTGKIGNWKNEFSDEHKKLFKDFCGQQLIDLGYENDFSW